MTSSHFLVRRLADSCAREPLGAWARATQVAILELPRPSELLAGLGGWVTGVAAGFASVEPRSLAAGRNWGESLDGVGVVRCATAFCIGSVGCRSHARPVAAGSGSSVAFPIAQAATRIELARGGGSFSRRRVPGLDVVQSRERSLTGDRGRRCGREADVLLGAGGLTSQIDRRDARGARRQSRLRDALLCSCGRSVRCRDRWRSPWRL